MTSPTPPEAGPRLVSVPDAAKQLGMSKDYMYKLIRGGKIPTVQMPTTTGGQRGDIGWGLRIEQSEIDAFIERNRTAAS